MKSFWILLSVPLLSLAHPMGNFSVNHYARMAPGPHVIAIEYVLDLAEIPTAQLQQEWQVTTTVQRADVEQRAARQAATWVRQLKLRSNGKAVTPELLGTTLTVNDGAGGLPTYRITMQIRVPSAGGVFTYEDTNFADRAGWREIVIVPQAGAHLQKVSQTAQDRSRGLTAYPSDASLTAPHDVRAAITLAVGSVVPDAKPTLTALEQPGVPSLSNATQPSAVSSTPIASRSGFLNRALGNRGQPIGIALALTCMLVAFGLGALHAVEPGHGKTMVAAYLVGSRGTAKHALLLGGMVTFTHTVSVFVLGFITLFLSQYILPATLTRYLGVISGLAIVWIGALLLYRRWRTYRHLTHHHHGTAHTHSHVHSHSHSHGVTHTHDGHTHTHVPGGEITMGSLLALGASGGLVPCPAALVLLLSCISLGHPSLGLLLLVTFSLGLALVLIALGLLVVAAKSLVPQHSHASADSYWMQILPVASAAVIVAVGVVMTGVSLGWIPAVRFLS